MSAVKLLIPVTLVLAFSCHCKQATTLIKQAELCRNSVIGTKRSDHNKEVAALGSDHYRQVARTREAIFNNIISSPDAENHSRRDS